VAQTRARRPGGGPRLRHFRAQGDRHFVRDTSKPTLTPMAGPLLTLVGFRQVPGTSTTRTIMPRVRTATPAVP